MKLLFRRDYLITISPPPIIINDDFDDQLVQCWNDASKIFRYYSFDYKEEKVIIESIWRDIEKFSADNDLELIITIKSATDISNHAYFFIHRYIEFIFLAINISLPGSIDVFNRKVKCVNPNNDFDDFDLSLTSQTIVSGWEVTNNFGNWPKINYIPLDKVYFWLMDIKFIFKQKATTNIERCLFSIINFCQNDTISPSNFLWMTHALEALYDTPREGILNSLRNRLLLFLGIPISHKDTIRKKINEIYQLRSEFVHGTMEIVREPMNEILDSTLNDYFSKRIDSDNFGMVLLIATIQKMINENLLELKFTEQYERN